jgi:adenosylhomocysteine nucleosidase
MMNDETQGHLSKTDARVCHVGVLFALSVESAGLDDLLQGAVTTKGHGFTVRQGELAGRHVVVVLSGPGRENAEKAAEALIAGHRPQWIISAGFAGGLDPKLRRADILLADQVVDPQGNQLAIAFGKGTVPFSSDENWDSPQNENWDNPRLILQSILAVSPNIHVGRLLTADRVVRLPQEKRALGQQHHALAVDMETFATVAVCQRHGTRVLAVRAISDAVDDELPRDVERLLAQKSRAAQLGAALGAIWRRPSSVKDMLKLKENALVASDRLAKFLVKMIETLT